MPLGWGGQNTHPRMLPRVVRSDYTGSVCSGSHWVPLVDSLGARQCVPAVMLDTQLVRVRYGTLSVRSLSPDCWGAFGAPMPT